MCKRLCYTAHGSAPEMLKNVSGIDVERLIKGLTQKGHSQSASTAKSEIVLPMKEASL